jgi:hypothetical protein
MFAMGAEREHAQQRPAFDFEAHRQSPLIDPDAKAFSDPSGGQNRLGSLGRGAARRRYAASRSSGLPRCAGLYWGASLLCERRN